MAGDIRKIGLPLVLIGQGVFGPPRSAVTLHPFISVSRLYSALRRKGLSGVNVRTEFPKGGGSDRRQREV